MAPPSAQAQVLSMSQPPTNTDLMQDVRSWHDPCGYHQPEFVSQPLCELLVNSHSVPASEKLAQQARGSTGSAVREASKAGLWGSGSQVVTGSKAARAGRNSGVSCGVSDRSCIGRRSSDHSDPHEVSSSSAGKHKAWEQCSAAKLGIAASKQVMSGVRKSNAANTRRPSKCLLGQKKRGNACSVGQQDVFQPEATSDSTELAEIIESQKEEFKAPCSSNFGRRKALLKALVRTTPTRAPSIASAELQPPAFNATRELGHTYEQRFHGQRNLKPSHAIAAEPQQIEQEHTFQMRTDLIPGSSSPRVTQTQAPVPGPDLHPATVLDDRSLPGQQSTAATQAHGAWQMQSQAVEADAGSGIAAAHTVRRSLLLQPGFC